MRKKIVVRGPALTRSGYGEQSRMALSALREYEDKFDIFLIPTTWGATGWIHEDSEEHRWLDFLIHKTNHYLNNGGVFDMSLQITIPNEWENMAPINIGYTAGMETTKVAHQWLEKANMMDRIVVISNHSKNVFESTVYYGKNSQTGEPIELKSTTDIGVVNYPIRFTESTEIDLELEYDFNFVTIAQWGPRKNMENTIRGFVEEFHDEEVGLVLKTSIAKNCLIDRDNTRGTIRGILDNYPDRKCKVYMVHGSMTTEEVAALYVHPKIKSLVAISHGEGFGLPIFEAVCNGMPVITINWSGQKDFLYAPTKGKSKNKPKMRPHFSKVEHTLSPIPDSVVWEGVLVKDSEWAYPDQDSYKKQLRDVYNNYDRKLSQAKKLKKYVDVEFTKEKKYKEFADFVMGLDVEDAETEKVLVFG